MSNPNLSRVSWIDCITSLLSAKKELNQFPYSKSGPHDTDRQHKIIREIYNDIEKVEKQIYEYLRLTHQRFEEAKNKTE